MFVVNAGLAKRLPEDALRAGEGMQIKKLAPHYTAIFVIIYLITFLPDSPIDLHHHYLRLNFDLFPLPRPVSLQSMALYY